MILDTDFKAKVVRALAPVLSPAKVSAIVFLVTDLNSTDLEVSAISSVPKSAVAFVVEHGIDCLFGRDTNALIRANRAGEVVDEIRGSSAE